MQLQSRVPPVLQALAYFVTFRPYGTWLAGDARGSVPIDNRPGQPRRPPNPALEAAMRERLVHPPTTFGPRERKAVQEAAREVCDYRGWTLLAACVLADHTHWVVRAPGHTGERVMNDFKAYATRRLRQDGLAGPEEKLWARHGSVRQLLTAPAVDQVLRYVLERQGDGPHEAWWPDGHRLENSNALPGPLADAQGSRRDRVAPGEGFPFA